MSEEKKGQEELKEYAGGWMTERKGTDAPGFLKLAFPVIGLGCVAYLFLQIYGDVDHATRDPWSSSSTWWPRPTRCSATPWPPWP